MKRFILLFAVMFLFGTIAGTGTLSGNPSPLVNTVIQHPKHPPHPPTPPKPHSVKKPPKPHEPKKPKEPSKPPKPKSPKKPPAPHHL